MGTKQALKQVLRFRQILKRYGVDVKITALSEAFKQKEDDGHLYSYPECIEITVENWSTSHYSVRVSDLCWIRSGQNLNRTDHVSAFKVLRMHMREIKAFAASKAEHAKSKIVFI